MKHGHRQLGLTLIELTFALFALSFLGLGIGSIMVAAGDAWGTRDAFANQTQTARGLSTRLSQWVRQSKRIVSLNTNGTHTDLVLWATDSFQPNEVNIGEVQVISYNSDTGTLGLHLMELTDSQAADAGVNRPIAPSEVGAADFGPRFRATNGVASHVISDQVDTYQAALGVMPGNADYDYVELKLTLASPQGAMPQMALVAATVRAPDQQIDFMNGQIGDVADDADDSDGDGAVTNDNGGRDDDWNRDRRRGRIGTIIRTVVTRVVTRARSR